MYSKSNLNLAERQDSSSKFIQTNSTTTIKLENSKLSKDDIVSDSSFTIFSPDKNTTLFPIQHFKSKNKLTRKKKLSEINKLESTLFNTQTNINSFIALNNNSNSVKNLSDLLTITTANTIQKNNINTISHQQNSYLYNSLLQLPSSLEQQSTSFQHFSEPSRLNSTLLIQNDSLQKMPLNDYNFLHTLNILNKQQPIYYCFLCSKKLENYLMYMLHWNLVHFKNNITLSKSKFNFLQELSNNNLQIEELLASDDKKLVR